MESALKTFGLRPVDFTDIKEAPSGLINTTYLCYGRKPGKSWVLQRLNTDVFKRPEDVAHNIELVRSIVENSPRQGESKEHVRIQLLYPVPNKKGKLFSVIEGQYWRLMPLLEGTMTYDVVGTAKHAFEAAGQFGLLTFSLHSADVSMFKIPISDFHNLSKYSLAFNRALDASNREGREHLLALQSYENMIVGDFERKWKSLPIRIMHHDTKISNILFNPDGKGVAPIDLDTLSPGLVVSDVGDMVRTYICSKDENEPNTEKLRAGMNHADEIFREIVRGYVQSSGLGAILTDDEISSLTYAGPFMIYMQSLRFATDYLLYDVYYPVSYESQNIDRALNQLCLLEYVLERRQAWRQIVTNETGRDDVVPW